MGRRLRTAKEEWKRKRESEKEGRGDEKRKRSSGKGERKGRWMKSTKEE